MVPLGSVASVNDAGGPALVIRYNRRDRSRDSTALRFPAVSSGTVIKTVERRRESRIATGNESAVDRTYAYCRFRAGNTAIIVFCLGRRAGVSRPGGAVRKSQPCLGRDSRRSYVPVVLCCRRGAGQAGHQHFSCRSALSCSSAWPAKNAILIVEFAKEKSAQGASPVRPPSKPAGCALRPIIMTSLAFILGVVPLALAVGAGAEMRRTLAGSPSFSGMLGVTLFGIFLTPVFYYLVVRLGRQPKARQPVHSNPVVPVPTSKAGPVIATVAGDRCGWMTTTLRGDRLLFANHRCQAIQRTPERPTGR